MPEKYPGEELRKALKFIKNSDDPLNIAKIGEEVDLNLMFLSGALTVFSMLGALNKTELGGQHLYDIDDREILKLIFKKTRS